jgi:hypothetical protein
MEESEYSEVILRNSARREVIIGEIQELFSKEDQCTAVFRNSMKESEMPEQLMRYGVFYGVYLNQLICPMKFFEL